MRNLRAALLVGLTAVAFAGCAGHVAMPADNASPEDVVRAYVDAVNAKDCSTAKSLSTNAGAWCGKTTLNDLQITGVIDEKRASAPDQVAKHVAVEFTLHGGDGSMNEGHQSWGYLLAPTGPNGAWRIYDQGVA